MVQAANLQRGPLWLCSAGVLSTSRPHIHSAACWFTPPNSRGRENVPISSMFPKHSPRIRGAFPLQLQQPISTTPNPFLFLFSIFAPALGLFPLLAPCSPPLCFSATPFCFQASSQSPLDSVSRQFGWKNECKGGRGRREDKATSVSDTNMAQCQHQYYVYAPSLPASHRVTALHLPLLTAPPHPSTRPSKCVLCLHSDSPSCYFGLWKRRFGSFPVRITGGPIGGRF